ncbi:single-stranded DNA-binding protein [uncultured Actinomyces sp.]|uniref:single-stranded DNA-binding protein n=1 Tax=uncultured Actinomyces sp. TaxID=249061 RepID=UPI0028E4228B|nr:single-stranded DNA-binding protein [uncultured Actinomyces sp.]
MMQDISTTLKGRIGSVPTMKHIKGDTCVTTFRLAIPRWRFTVDARTGNASYVEDGAYWYTIETWDKLADNVVRCCCKGDPVIVVARPVPNAWVDANGQIRSSIVFRASAVGHDMAKGTSRYTKNGAHSTQEPTAGSPDDPFSTRQGQAPPDERGNGAAGFAPAELGEPHGEGTTDARGAEPGGAGEPACVSVAAPSAAPGDDRGAPSLAVQPDVEAHANDGSGPAERSGPLLHMHDGPEEQSSDPCMSAVSRFDYSAVEHTPEPPDEQEGDVPGDC